MHYDLRKLFSGKITSIFIILIAVAGRVLQVLYFFNIRSDRSFQLLATDNLLHGNGLSTSEVFASDLSNPVFEPLIKWPPGYSLLLSPFYKLFNHDYVKAALTLDLFFAIAFVFVVRSIAKQVQLEIHLVNLITLFAGFFIYDFYFISSTDAIAITFFLAGISGCMYLIRKKRNEYPVLAAIAVCLFAAAFLKYLFIPVVFIVPFYFVVKGLRSGVHWMKKPGYILFLFLAIGIGAMFLYQRPLADATYTGEGTKGFFPGNLRESYPFITASFVKPATVFELIEVKLSGLFLLLHLSLLAAWIVLILWLRQVRAGLHTAVQFTQLTFLVSIFLTLVLLFLSVTTAKHEEMPGYFWTYVQERRYYGLASVLIQILAFTLFQYSFTRKSKILRWIVLIMLVLSIPELVRGVIHSSKRLINLNKEEYSWQYDKGFQKVAAKIIETEKKNSKIETVVVTSPDYYFSNRISLETHAHVLYDPSKLNGSLNSSKPAIVLFVLPDTDTALFQPIAARTKQAGAYKNLLFFIEHVKPQ